MYRGLLKQLCAVQDEVRVAEIIINKGLLATGHVEEMTMTPESAEAPDEERLYFCLAGILEATELMIDRLDRRQMEG